MKSYTYKEPRTFLKYNDSQYIVYLNEEIIKNYIPSTLYSNFEQEPYTGYKYTGGLPDGGTLINCLSPTRNELINGIIRSKYSQTEEDALKTHQIELLKNSVPENKVTEYNNEWNNFNAFRTYVITTVDKWINN